MFRGIGFGGLGLRIKGQGPRYRSKVLRVLRFGGSGFRVKGFRV